MEEENHIDKFRKKEKPNYWKAEKTITLTTLMGSELTINRILYTGPNADPKKPKRCLSITKNTKSVAFDIEMYQAIMQSLSQLGEGFELKEPV